MLGRTWPRFALEALFLFAVAAVAGLLDLSIPGIVAVMVVAYAATVVLEWSASRRRTPASEARTEGAAAGPVEPVLAAAVRAEPVVEEPEPVVTEPETEPRPVAEVELEPEAEAQPESPEVEAPEMEPDVEPEAETEPVVDKPLVEVEGSVGPVVPVPREPEPTAQLTSVPDPEPEPEPELEPAAEPEPNRVVALPLPAQPQAWNLWEIERLLRDSPEHDPAREEEQNYLLMYLRDFASPDGILPVDFDALVRESFGELVAGRNA